MKLTKFSDKFSPFMLSFLSNTVVNFLSLLKSFFETLYKDKRNRGKRFQLPNATSNETNLALEPVSQTSSSPDREVASNIFVSYFLFFRNKNNFRSPFGNFLFMFFVNW